MNTKQDTRIVMNCVIRDFLMKNEPILRLLPEGSILLNSFFANVLSINFFNNQLKETGEKSTENKSIAKLEIADRAIEMKNRILAYAAFNGESSIPARINFNDEALIHSNDSDLVEKSRAILRVANEYIEKLMMFGLIKEMVSDLEKMVGCFAVNLYSSANNDTEQAVEQNRISKLLDSNDAILFRIDEVIEQNKKSYSEFYDEYFRLRNLDIKRYHTESKVR